MINETLNEMKKLENKLRERKRILDMQFQFTPENIKKIADFNEVLLRKSHELFDKIDNIKRNYDFQIKNGDNSLLIDGHYAIFGEINITSEGKELYDVAHHQRPYQIITTFDDCNFERVSVLMENENWDIENLQPLNKYSIHICNAMHHFFTDGIFALSDIFLLNKNDISLFISIELF